MKRICIFGLLLTTSIFSLTACGGSNGVTVQVTLTDFQVASSLTTFSTGTLYHFEVTNKSAENHEFTIMAPMTGNMSMDEMHKAALAYIDTIAPGETKTLDYTFTRADSNLELACHLGKHYQEGMHTAIIVVSY